MYCFDDQANEQSCGSVVAVPRRQAVINEDGTLAAAAQFPCTSTPWFVRSQSNGVSGSRPNSTRPVDCMTRGCVPMCCVMACTSRNARSNGQLTYSELAPPATYIRSTACT